MRVTGGKKRSFSLVICFKHGLRLWLIQDDKIEIINDIDH